MSNDSDYRGATAFLLVYALHHVFNKTSHTLHSTAFTTTTSRKQDEDDGDGDRDVSTRSLSVGGSVESKVGAGVTTFVPLKVPLRRANSAGMIPADSCSSSSSSLLPGPSGTGSPRDIRLRELARTGQQLPVKPPIQASMSNVSAAGSLILSGPGNVNKQGRMVTIKREKAKTFLEQQAEHKHTRSRTLSSSVITPPIVASSTASSSSAIADSIAERAQRLKLQLTGRKLDGAYIDTIRLYDLISLRTSFPSANVNNHVGNTFKCEADRLEKQEEEDGGGGINANCTLIDSNGTGEAKESVAYTNLLGAEDYVINSIVRKNDNSVTAAAAGSGIRGEVNEQQASKQAKKLQEQHTTDAYVRAGPRIHTHFDPITVRAAIVTCGGLCPGLNNVIRELTHALWYLYNVDSIVGIRGGYHGFNAKSGFDAINLTPEVVESCHHQGGTILASSRGGFDLEIILAFLKDNSIDQLYVIGGDGTHRGADKLAQACIERNMNISIIGIPKTIDNDIDLIDRSFGFNTSVEVAQSAIRSAKTEAKCNLPNGIGIVKLMGRSAGFIAVHATLASGDVDLCLVPEKQIHLTGSQGCLPFLMERVKENGHAVVVVAEGAGEELLGVNVQTDASGNKVLPAIGEFLKGKFSCSGVMLVGVA